MPIYVSEGRPRGRRVPKVYTYTPPAIYITLRGIDHYDENAWLSRAPVVDDYYGMMIGAPEDSGWYHWYPYTRISGYPSVGYGEQFSVSLGFSDYYDETDWNKIASFLTDDSFAILIGTDADSEWYLSNHTYLTYSSVMRGVGSGYSVSESFIDHYDDTSYSGGDAGLEDDPYGRLI